MKNKNTVLVVAAHPDDEILGCGGALLKHVQNQDDVYIMIMAEGITSRGAINTVSGSKEALTALHDVSRKVAASLGAKHLEMCNFPDNRMDSVPLLDVVKKIELEIHSCNPNIVYTHHSGDVNIDHAITHQAVITACRPYPGQCVKTLLFFETLSSTEWQPEASGKYFTPNWMSDITPQFQGKIDLLKYYESEMRKWPYPRSLEGVEFLARYRGGSIGVDYAEAFMLGRMII